MWVFNSPVLCCEPPQWKDWGVSYNCLSQLSSGIKDAPGTQVRHGWGWADEGREHLQISQSWKPPSPGSCPKIGRCLSCHHQVKPAVAQPWGIGILSAGLSWKKGPSGLASIEGALIDGTCVKAFIHAHGTAPLFPFKRPFIYGNGNKCLLRHGWVWCVDSCTHRWCFSGVNRLLQLSTNLKAFCIWLFACCYFDRPPTQNALHHSSLPDIELHILNEGDFPNVLKVFSTFIWP